MQIYFLFLRGEVGKPYQRGWCVFCLNRGLHRFRGFRCRTHETMNKLYFGDNLEIMREMDDERVDLTEFLMNA